MIELARNHLKRSFIICVLWFVLGALLPAAQLAALQLRDDPLPITELAPYLEILEDPSGELRIEDVIA